MAHSMNICDAAIRLEPQTALPQDEVHLWRVDLAAVSKEQERWHAILSPEERTRAARFHFSRDREYFTATRALLRTILGSYLSSDPVELVFRYSGKDKPSLTTSQAENQVQFNVSHSGDAAMLTFARGRALGVDVEQVRDNFDHVAIARRFFSEQEQRELAALAPSERCYGFFRCWTRKEAYVKAQGAGLSLPLSQFDVSLKPGEEDALLSTRPDRDEAARWSLREVPAGDGYLAALCVQGRGWKLQL
jgi:4'-phosphopantetheinyl transferase